MTCYAIYTEQVDNCLKVRLRAKHKQAFCNFVCVCIYVKERAICPCGTKRKSVSHDCQAVCPGYKALLCQKSVCAEKGDEETNSVL